MTPEEFQTLYPRVIGWIRETLDAHASDARIVASLRFPRLPRHFSDSC
jgi:hypothetical protein